MPAMIDMRFVVVKDKHVILSRAEFFDGETGAAYHLVEVDLTKEPKLCDALRVVEAELRRFITHPPLRLVKKPEGDESP